MYSWRKTKQIVNGQVVEDTAVKTEYDGKTLHVDKVDNNKFMHFTLDDKQLKKMLKNNTSKLGLLERLSENYMARPRQSKRPRRQSKRPRRQSKKIKKKGKN